MRCQRALALITLLLVSLLSPLAPHVRAGGKRTTVTADEVKKSIDKAIRYLRSHQRENGGWEIELLTGVAASGGSSGLVLLALLNGGVPLDDPMIARGLKFLRSLHPDNTYARALQTMVFAEARQGEDRERIAENVKWLIDARVFIPEFTGWSYRQGAHQRGDGSNTQYALLGLHAGSQSGIAIDKEIWKSIRDFYVRTQTADGGYLYQKDHSPIPSPTMTTAGLCGLIIAGMELNAGREILQPDGTAVNCGVYKEDQAVNRALNWITSRGLEIEYRGALFYNLYGIERAGRLTGLRFIGRYDWYREGCRYLVDTQHDDGSWTGEHQWDRMPIISTSFALLFLSKGRTPILVSKLVHTDSWPRRDDDTDWNNDRNDLRNLTAFASKELFNRLPLGWQNFDMRRDAPATPTEGDLMEVTSHMLESPVVYFNGHKSPVGRFQDVEKTLLKKYVENGGFLLVEACCGSPDFDQGFKKLAEELWPDNPLENLPAQHPLWRAKFVVNPGEPYHLMGIQMGCKTVLVYSPEDLSCQWESAKSDDGRGAAAFRLGANIIAYATGMEPPRPRLTHVEVASDKDDSGKLPRGFFKVGQVKFQGDYKPAPRAMRNLMDHMHKFAALDVVLKTDEVRVFDPSVKDYKFLYLHGRGKLSFGPEELENLRFNLENGALLLADACCGQQTFDTSFRHFAQELFPKHKLERIPLNDPLFGRELNGVALDEKNIKCRQEKNSTPRNMPPVLEGIKIDGRWAVIYSKYDIGCALERHQSSDCVGYTPESALLLAKAAVLYSLRP
jgi:hypothetical protein